MKLSNVFKALIKQAVRWADNDDFSEANNAIPIPRGPSGYGSNPSGPLTVGGNTGLNFTIFPAIGGKVIQLNTYDLRTDRHSVSLYIVTDKDDLGAELGLIITKECLTR